MIPAPLLVAQMVSVLFVCGALGNLYVIITSTRFLWRSYRSVEDLEIHQDSNHLTVYLLAKALADCSILCCCPVIINFILSGSWTHGYGPCLLYWLVEQSCTKSSALITACLVFDRFVWLRWRLRWSFVFNVRTALVACTIVNVLAISIVTPILPRVDTFEIVDEAENNTTIAEACLLDIYEMEDLIGAYLIFWLIFTFVLPLILAVYCIYGCFRYLFLNAHQAVDRLGELRYRTERVTSLCLGGMLALYVFCAGPHWIMSLLVSLSPLFTSPRTNEAFLMFILHLLPYLNAAGTWMFSALISRSLLKYVRQRAREMQRHETGEDGEEFGEMVALETIYERRDEEGVVEEEGFRRWAARRSSTRAPAVGGAREELAFGFQREVAI